MTSKPNIIEEYGMRFYKGKNSQQAAIDYAEENMNSIHMAVEKQVYDERGMGTFMYTSFKDHKDFLRKYVKVPKEQRFFHEKLYKSFVEVYDIDGRFSDIAGGEEKIISRLVVLRNQFLETTGNMWHIPTEGQKVIVTSASNPSDDKLSLHVIIRGSHYWSNYKVAKKFVTQFNQYIKASGNVIPINLNIYTKYAHLRIIGSTNGSISGPLKKYGASINERNPLLFFATYIEEGDKPVNDPFPDIEEITIKKNDSDECPPAEESYVRHLCNCLSSERWLNYDSWCRIAAILAGIKNFNYRDLFVEFSEKRATKDEAIEKFNSFKDMDRENSLTIATLHMWAIADDCDLYKTVKTPTKYDEHLYSNPISRDITSVESDLEYVAPISIKELEYPIHIIDAYMGMGKSTAACDTIAKLLKKNDNCRVLVLSSRRSHASNQHKELNRRFPGKFDLYMDMTNYKLEQSNRVVCQVESLYRLDLTKNTKPWDIVVVDECESVLTQLTCIETNGTNIIKNGQVFTNSIKNTRLCMLMDAFISNKTFNFIDGMGLGSKALHTKYTRPPVARTVEIYKMDSAIKNAGKKMDTENRWLTKIINDLVNNKKIYLFVSSKRKAMAIDAKIKQDERLSDKTVFVYYGGTDKSKTKYENIAEDWSTADLVITTACITVGIDYSVKEEKTLERFRNRTVFDRIYMYINACSRNLVRNCIQAHMRVRHIRDNHMIVFMDVRTIGIWVPTIRYNIKMMMGYRDRFYRDIFVDGYINIENYWKDLYITNELEVNQSIMFLEKVLMHYLKKCNYTIIKSDNDSLTPIEEMDEIPKMAYVSAVILEKEMFAKSGEKSKLVWIKKLMNKHRAEKTGDDRVIITKYRFDTNHYSALVNQYNDMDDDYGYRYAMEHIEDRWTIYTEKNLAVRIASHVMSDNRHDDICARSHNKHLYNKGDEAACKLMVDLLDILDVDLSSKELQCIDNDFPDKKPELDMIFEKAKSIKIRLYSKVKTTENPTQIEIKRVLYSKLKLFLSKVGLISLRLGNSGKRTTINGKRVRIPLYIVYIDDALLEPSPFYPPPIQ